MPDKSDAAQRYELLEKVLNERQRRMLVAVEAKVLGRGGISLVAKATGVSRETIRTGLAELEAVKADKIVEVVEERVRRSGGGRKKAIEKDAAILTDLEELVDPVTRGDPESPLRWTCKSLRMLAMELKARGHAVSHVVIGELLKSQGYSLQANAKTLEGGENPDRNAQFEHINACVKTALAAGEPVISVDTKKKELVGCYKNNGREWRKKGKPESVKVHDFVDPELGRANPYGVYDLGDDSAWVSIGTDHDTAAFAVETIRRWWHSMGRQRYPNATELTITADDGGSNGYRVRLWKWELQKLADELGIAIRVCHFPPGTSKWNKIEHRLFSFISLNWRSRPLVSHEVIVNLIANTTTRSGLAVHAALDNNDYPKGVAISDEAFASIRLERDSFHGEWNYHIRPN